MTAESDHEFESASAAPRDAKLTLKQVRVRAGRLQLAREALEILETSGWDAVSVTELADRVGVSTRTFHRYFPNKVDVFRPLLENGGTHARAAFADARGRTLARRCADSLLAGVSTFPGGTSGAHLGFRLLMTTPDLKPVWLDEAHRFERDLVPHLDGVLFDDGPRAPARSVDDGRLSAAVLFAAMRLAMETWIENDDADALHDLTMQAVERTVSRVR